MYKRADLGGTSHPIGSGGPTTYQINVAAAVPLYSTVIVMGYNYGSKTLVSVTDTPGNVYTVRVGGAADGYPSMLLADAPINLPLAVNNKIYVNMSGSDSFVAVCAASYSDCSFHTCSAQATYTGPAGQPLAVTAPPVTTVLEYELVLGLFGGYMAYSKYFIAIQTPGPGYTNQPGYGIAADAPVRSLGQGLSVDWESKILEVPGVEAPSATIDTKADADRRMMTAAYWDLLPNQMLSAV